MKRPSFAQLLTYARAWGHATRFSGDHRADIKRIAAVYAGLQHKIDSATPSRYLWRSVAQCRCHSYTRGLLGERLSNVVAFVLLPFTVLLVRRATTSPKAPKVKYLKIDFHEAYVIPDRIRSQTLERQSTERYLTLSDLRFAFGLFARHRAFYPELLLAFIMWISRVRPQLDAASVEFLIQYCEYSAYSSLRKLYANWRGVGLANVTHGEEFISCRSAFSSFDQYFSWEMTPIAIHDAMHVECGERFVFNPCADLEPAQQRAETTHIGILWPSTDGPLVQELVGQIKKVSRLANVIIRPHPNPAYRPQFATYYPELGVPLSDPHAESIHDYVDRCDIILGCLSAAMLQAFFRNRAIVYFNDEALASVRKYHAYYKGARSIDVGDLETFVITLLPESTKRVG